MNKKDNMKKYDWDSDEVAFAADAIGYYHPFHYGQEVTIDGEVKDGEWGEKVYPNKKIIDWDEEHYNQPSITVSLHSGKDAQEVCDEIVSELRRRIKNKEDLDG